MTEASRHCPHTELRRLFFSWFHLMFGGYFIYFHIRSWEYYQADPIRTTADTSANPPRSQTAKRGSSQVWTWAAKGDPRADPFYWINMRKDQPHKMDDSIPELQIMWGRWPNLGPSLNCLGVRLRQRENQLSGKVLTLFRASSAGRMGPWLSK